MKSIITTAALLAMLGTTFTACKKDKKEDPAPQQPAPPANEAELITTMKITLRDTTTNINTTYVFSDLDGAGGNPATFGNSGADSVINITANHVYEATILLLDQQKLQQIRFRMRWKKKAQTTCSFLIALHQLVLHTTPI